MLTLYGCRGCGSAVVEAALRLLGEPYQQVEWAWEDESGWLTLARINPLRQVPTILREDGTVLTESAAILLWLLERAAAGRFAPERGSAGYATFLRWLMYLNANIYVPIGIGDFPERWLAIEAAREQLTHGTVERSKASWLLFEESVKPQPYLLGASLGFLDLYVAMLTRWRPGRDWIAAHCPRIAAVVALTEADPVVAAVWKDNF